MSPQSQVLREVAGSLNVPVQIAHGVYQAGKGVGEIYKSLPYGLPAAPPVAQPGIAQRPDLRGAARGASDVIEGAVEATAPLVGAQIARLPAKVALRAGAAVLAGYGAQKGTEAALPESVAPEYRALLSNLAGLVGAVLAGEALGRGTVKAVIKGTYPEMAEDSAARRILGVSETATPEEITRAYREKVRVLHPDKPTGNAEEFIRVQAAYEHLTPRAEQAAPPEPERAAPKAQPAPEAPKAATPEAPPEPEVPPESQAIVPGMKVQTPRGLKTVTDVEPGWVTYDLTLPNGMPMPGVRMRTEDFRKDMAQAPEAAPPETPGPILDHRTPATEPSEPVSPAKIEPEPAPVITPTQSAPEVPPVAPEAISPERRAPENIPAVPGPSPVVPPPAPREEVVPTAPVPEVTGQAASQHPTIAEIQRTLQRAIEVADQYHAEDETIPDSRHSPSVALLREILEREQLRASEHVGDLVAPVFDRAEAYYQTEYQRLANALWGPSAAPQPEAPAPAPAEAPQPAPPAGQPEPAPPAPTQPAVPEVAVGQGGGSGEAFRGAWNVKVNATGQQQVAEAAQRTAGKFDKIYSGTLDRHKDTAAKYGETNPQAGTVVHSRSFDPMHMGQFEGQPVTPERVTDLNRRMVENPDKPIPGTGKYSKLPGEKPSDWSNRLLSAVRRIVKGYKPGQRILIVTSGRDTQAVRAWAAKGMPANLAMDPQVLTSEWKTKPGQLMRLDPSGTITDVENADAPGIYFGRHGQTDANGGAGGAAATVTPAPTAAPTPAVQPEAPKTFTDKSVRDFPVKASISDDGSKISITFSIGRRPYGTITLHRLEWENPPGGTVGNRDWDRRQLIRQKMERTIGSGNLPIASFTQENAGQAERLADAAMNAAKKVSPLPVQTYPGRFAVGEEVETMNPVTRKWERGRVSTLEPDGKIGVSFGGAPYLFAPQHVRGVSQELSTAKTDFGFVQLSPNVRVPVKTADQASAVVRRYIEQNNMGASQMTENFGLITDAKGNPVARVAYNGRVFDLQGNVLQEAFDTPTGAKSPFEEARDRMRQKVREEGAVPVRKHWTEMSEAEKDAEAQRNYGHLGDAQLREEMRHVTPIAQNQIQRVLDSRSKAEPSVTISDGTKVTPEAVSMSHEDFAKEHEELPKILREGTKAEREAEAAKQAKELEEVKAAIPDVMRKVSPSSAADFQAVSPEVEDELRKNSTDKNFSRREPYNRAAADEGYDGWIKFTVGDTAYVAHHSPYRASVLGRLGIVREGRPGYFDVYTAEETTQGKLSRNPLFRLSDQNILRPTITQSRSSELEPAKASVVRMAPRTNIQKAIGVEKELADLMKQRESMSETINGLRRQAYEQGGRENLVPSALAHLENLENQIDGLDDQIRELEDQRDSLLEKEDSEEWVREAAAELGHAVAEKPRIEQFMEVYERRLREAVQQHPKDYTYGVDKVPAVAARMRKALEEGTYASSPTIIATQKELGIPTNRKGLAAWLKEGEVAPTTAAEPPAKPTAQERFDAALARVDDALARMRERGHQETDSYRRLLDKRNAMARGESFTIDDVTERLIAQAGAGIGELTRETGLRREDLGIRTQTQEQRLSEQAEQIRADEDALARAQEEEGFDFAELETQTSESLADVRQAAEAFHRMEDIKAGYEDTARTTPEQTRAFENSRYIGRPRGDQEDEINRDLILAAREYQAAQRRYDDQLERAAENNPMLVYQPGFRPTEIEIPKDEAADSQLRASTDAVNDALGQVLEAERAYHEEDAKSLARDLQVQLKDLDLDIRDLQQADPDIMRAALDIQKMAKEALDRVQAEGYAPPLPELPESKDPTVVTEWIRSHSPLAFTRNDQFASYGNHAVYPLTDGRLVWVMNVTEPGKPTSIGKQSVVAVSPTSEDLDPDWSSEQDLRNKLDDEVADGAMRPEARDRILKMFDRERPKTAPPAIEEVEAEVPPEPEPEPVPPPEVEAKVQRPASVKVDLADAARRRPVEPRMADVEAQKDVGLTKAQAKTVEYEKGYRSYQNLAPNKESERILEVFDPYWWEWKPAGTFTEYKGSYSGYGGYRTRQTLDQHADEKLLAKYPHVKPGLLDQETLNAATKEFNEASQGVTVQMPAAVAKQLERMQGIFSERPLWTFRDTVLKDAKRQLEEWRKLYERSPQWDELFKGTDLQRIHDYVGHPQDPIGTERREQARFQALADRYPESATMDTVQERAEKDLGTDETLASYKDGWRILKTEYKGRRPYFTVQKFDPQTWMWDSHWDARQVDKTTALRVFKEQTAEEPLTEAKLQEDMAQIHRVLEAREKRKRTPAELKAAEREQALPNRKPDMTKPFTYEVKGENMRYYLNFPDGEKWGPSPWVLNIHDRSPVVETWHGPELDLEKAKGEAIARWFNDGIETLRKRAIYSGPEYTKKVNDLRSKAAQMLAPVGRPPVLGTRTVDKFERKYSVVPMIRGHEDIGYEVRYPDAEGNWEADTYGRFAGGMGENTYDAAIEQWLNENAEVVGEYDLDDPVAQEVAADVAKTQKIKAAPVMKAKSAEPERTGEFDSLPAKVEVTLPAKDAKALIPVMRSVMGKRTLIPILGNVSIVTKDGKTTITGTDLETAAQFTLTTPGVNDGAVTLPLSALESAAKGKSKENIAINANDKTATLTVGSAESGTDTMAIASFPELPKTNHAVGNLPVEALMDAMRYVQDSISGEESRFTLNGALFLLEPGKVTLVATDGHRLALRAFPAKGLKGETRLLIPKAAMASVAKALSGEETPLSLKTDAVKDDPGNHVSFENKDGSIRILSRKLTGNFPDYNRVLPDEKEYTHRVVVNRKALADLMKNTLALKDRSNGVVISIRPGQIITFSKFDEKTAKGKAPAKVERIGGGEVGNPRIGMNAAYINDVLKATDAETVEIIVKEGKEENAVVMRPAGDLNSTTVIMPMRQMDKGFDDGLPPAKRAEEPEPPVESRRFPLVQKAIDKLLGDRSTAKVEAQQSTGAVKLDLKSVPRFSGDLRKPSADATPTEVARYFGAAKFRLGNMGGRPVLWVNNAGADAIFQTLKQTSLNSADTTGECMTAKEINQVLENARKVSTKPKGQRTPQETASLSLAEAISPLSPRAKAEGGPVPLMVVQSGSSMTPEEIRGTAEHEYDHYSQMLLPQGLRGLPTEILDTPEGQIASEVLARAGYTLTDPASPFLDRFRSLYTAEITARLMRPEAWQELGLTREQAIKLAMAYVEGLERMHGDRAESIVRQVEDVFPEVKARHERRPEAGGTEHPAGATGIEERRATGPPEVSGGADRRVAPAAEVAGRPVILQDFVASRGGFASPGRMVIRSERPVSAEEIRNAFFSDLGPEELHITKKQPDAFMEAAQPGRQPFDLQFMENGRHVSVPEGVEERFGIPKGEDYHTHVSLQEVMPGAKPGRIVRETQAGPSIAEIRDIITRAQREPSRSLSKPLGSTVQSVYADLDWDLRRGPDAPSGAVLAVNRQSMMLISEANGHRISGFHMAGPSTVRLADLIEQSAHDRLIAGEITLAGAGKALDLAEQIRDTSGWADGVTVYETGSHRQPGAIFSTLRHELTHAELFIVEGRIPRTLVNAFYEEFNSLHEVSGLKATLDRLGYDTIDPTTLASEAAAHIFSGQGEELGLSPDEQVAIARTLFRLVEKHFGRGNAEAVLRYATRPFRMEAYGNRTSGSPGEQSAETTRGLGGKPVSDLEKGRRRGGEEGTGPQGRFEQEIQRTPPGEEGPLGPRLRPPRPPGTPPGPQPPGTPEDEVRPDVAALTEELKEVKGPKRNFSFGTYWKRVFLPGQRLAEVEAASTQVFERALEAGSWKSISSLLTRSTINAIDRTLKDTNVGGERFNWTRMRATLTEDRLMGLQDRWQQYSDTFGTATEAEIKQLMEGEADDGHNYFLELLGIVEGKGGMGEDLQQIAAGLLQREDWRTLGEFMADTFYECGSRVNYQILPDEEFDRNMDFLQNDPRGQEAVRIYRQNFEGPYRDQHLANEGTLGTVGRNLQLYIPLIPTTPHTPDVGTRRLPMKAPRNPAEHFATGLAPEYSLTMDGFVDRISRDVRANSRAGLVNTLKETGWAKPKPRNWDGMFEGPDGVLYTGVAGQSSEARTIIQGGRKVTIPGQQYIVPEFVWKGLEPILQKQPPSEDAITKVIGFLNSLALRYTPAELAFHTKGVLGAVNMNTAWLGPTGLDKVLSAPILRFFSIPFYMARINPESPENLAKLQEMAKAGAVPSKLGKVTLSREFAEAYGVKWEPTFGSMLYGPSGIDARARILMYDMFKAAVESGLIEDTRANLYHFVNQIGNYTPEFQGAIERWAKGIGLGPFATAGMTRNVNTFHGYTLTGPGNWKMKALQGLMGGVLMGLTLWVLSYKYLTGKWPTQDRRAKLFQVPVDVKGSSIVDKAARANREIGTKLWGKDWAAGKESGYLDFGFSFPLVERGAKLFGVTHAFEVKNMGGSQRQVMDAAAMDVANSLAHPFEGPAFSSAFTFTTGLNPYLIKLHEGGRPKIGFMGAFPEKGKRGFIGGFAPSTVPGRPEVKHPGIGHEFGARTAEALKGLNGFWGRIGENTGVLGPEAEDKGSAFWRIPLDLAFPGLIKNASNPYKEMEALRQDRRRAGGQ